MRRLRAGIALPGTLLIVLLLGLLSAAASFSIARAERAGALRDDDARLAAADDDLLVDALASASAPAETLVVGATQTLSIAARPGVRGGGWLTRVGPELFSISVEVLRGGPATTGGPVRRRATLLARPPLTGLSITGAIVTAGAVQLASSVTFPGPDTAAASGCRDTAATYPAVVLPPGVPLDASSITGAQVDRRSEASLPETYTRFLAADLETLVAGADIVLRPGSAVHPEPPVTGVCTAGGTDWGDPSPTSSSSCAVRFPVVYALGDLTLDGGRGQGVLVVEGLLRLGADAEFHGLVVARGGVESAGSGARITGAILVPDSTRDVRLSAATTVQASPCAVRRALGAHVGLRRVVERGWIEVY